MTMKRALPFLTLSAIVVLGLQYTAVGQGVSTAVTTFLYGTTRAGAVVLIDPDTSAPVDYSSDTKGAGNVDSGTARTYEADDSPFVVGIGPTSASAATAGGTGSLSAKLRLMTSQLADILTALQLIDDDQTGASGCAVVSAASTNATNCKTSAGRVFGIHVINTTTTVYYLRMYQATGAPTCSSATGFVQSYPIPPAAAAGQAGGFTFNFGPKGLAYGTGIAYCITAGSASTDNTNAAAGIFGTIAYQ